MKRFMLFWRMDNGHVSGGAVEAILGCEYVVYYFFFNGRMQITNGYLSIYGRYLSPLLSWINKFHVIVT